ncbi:MAG: sulfurtransferase TusA family protein [Desulfobacteraceae bacterium]|nr:sulfurtransferase TusA family protein [Desulfobacteraceae bacterium]
MSLDTIVADKVLNTSGLSCPMPLLKTKKILSTMAAGEIIEVICTDPGSQKDIPKFGDKGRNAFLGMVECDAGVFKYFIRKG